MQTSFGFPAYEFTMTIWDALSFGYCFVDDGENVYVSSVSHIVWGFEILDKEHC